ncbi:MAG: hypothetical protein ACOC4J_06575 [Bacteroidota bacterium]
MSFAQHLMGRGHFKEALFVLEDLKPQKKSQKDSLNFLLGWILYGQKDLETSANYLTKVSNESPFFHQSLFFAAYNYAYLDNTNLSGELLSSADFSSGTRFFYMRNFQYAGLALLDRDMESYQNLRKRLNNDFFLTQTEEKNFKSYYDQIKNQPRKSFFLAGFMSMLVPGAGKIYAGKTSEGIANFLYTGALLATTYDLYATLGAKNPFFIISAIVSGIFYTGNVWGSAVAVKRVQNEFNYEIDQRILLDMHIPLRKLFPD